MFRIERNLVHLGGVRTIRVNNETGEIIETIEEDPDVGIIPTGLNPQEVLAEAKQRAEHIIDSARNEANAIIEASKEDAENNRHQAWDEGYINGVDEGKRSYNDKILECDESLKRVMNEFLIEKKRAFSDMEDELLDLALRIVRKIINPADEAMEGVFVSLIKNALRQIAPDDRIMLRVSAADYERYFPEGSAVLELGNGVTVSASILKDASLGEFDCIIDKDDSTINAGLDTQLMNIQLAFEKS